MLRKWWQMNLKYDTFSKANDGKKIIKITVP